MRIVCEKCQATYHIPDEKIVRKTVRMTCRKCGEVITMRVDEETSGNATLGKWRASALNTPKKTQGETPSWYYSYNGESFGPYTQDELIAKIQSPSVNPVAKDCYVWTKSLGNWKPLVEVEPFASAVQPSVVPVPAAPVKKPASSVASLAVKRSSPDISSLKMKLLGGKAEHLETRALEEDRLDSRAETLTNSTPLNDAAPTHQAMPALDALVSNEASDADTVSKKVALFEDGDGRIKGGAPLLSFQSLDVIPDVCREDGSGKQERVAKPFPSLSTIKPISKTAEPASKAIPAFKPATSAVPGIVSLFGSKPAASGAGLKTSGLKPFSLGGVGAKGGGIKPVSSTGNASVKSEALSGTKDTSPLPLLESPRLNSASVSATAVKTPSSSLNKSVSSDANEFMLDHKEDLGDVLNSSEKNAAVSSSDRQDSMSDWIPSQMDLRLDSKMDGISLDSFSSPKEGKAPSTASQNALKENSQSISDVFKKEFGPEDGLECIDLDDDEDISVSSKDNASDSKDNASAQSVNGGEDALAAIDLDDVDSSSVTCIEAVEQFTTDEAHEDEGHDEEVNVVSATPLAQLLTGKAVQTKSESAQAEVQNEDEIEIGAIDLDSDNSSILPAAFISQAEDALAPKDGLSEGDESPVQAVARRSSRLDAIMKRQAELAAASEEIDKIDYSSKDNSDGPSEASMMIELSVLRDVEKKDSKSRNLKKIATIATVAVVFVGLALLVTMLANKKAPDKNEDNIASFGSAEGRAIDSDQLLNEVADVGEIEIVGGTARDKKRHHSSSGSAKKEESVQDETPVVDEPTVAQGVVPTMPQIRADGRRSADLGTAVQDNSALEAVAGSKYQGVAKSAADAPDRMNLGWKTVSRTVVACQKRLAKSGSLQVDKFYVNLKIKADGSVDDFTITATGNVDELVKCLESKKSTWDFGPGDATADRKVFVN